MLLTAAGGWFLTGGPGRGADADPTGGLQPVSTPSPGEVSPPDAAHPTEPDPAEVQRTIEPDPAEVQPTIEPAPANSPSRGEPPPVPGPSQVNAKIEEPKAPPPAASVAESKPASRRRERAAPVIAGDGSLVLATRLPNRSTVRIDGKRTIPLGPSPTSVTVAAGRRTLRIEREGATSCTVPVDIEPDRKRTLLIEADAVSELDGTSRKPLRCN